MAISRGRLLDAAERLFLEHGPDAVSVRMINAAAEFKPGAVHYHFGSKQGLILALLRDRLGPGQHAGDDGRPEAPNDSNIRDVVAAAADPLIRLGTGTPRQRLWLTLLVEAFRTDPDSALAVGAFPSDPWVARAIRTLPHLPPEVVRRRWTCATIALLAIVETPTDRDTVVTFLAGGLAAPEE